VLLLSLKLLDMLWRTFLFWLRLAVRAVLVAAAVGAGAWVWTRGLEGAVADCQGLAAHWVGEYRRYEGQARLARQAYSGAREGWQW
jgi:hypothetical protein